MGTMVKGLLFLAGLVLGFVIGGRLASVPVSDAAREAMAAGQEAAEGAVAAPQERAEAGPTKFWRRGGGRRHRGPAGRLSSGDAREDLEVLLGTFREIDDAAEVDPMELIRRFSLLSMLREEEAVDLLAHLSDKARDGEDEDEMLVIAGAVVFARLCELNGPRAMQLLADGGFGELARGSELEELAAMGMNSWVASDPEGARMWFEGLVGEMDGLAAGGGTEEDMTGMMKLLENDELRKAYFDGMVELDPFGLEERVAGLEHDEVREAMADELMESLVDRAGSVAELRGLLERDLAEGEGRLGAVTRMAELDPGAAAGWVGDQPASELRDREVATVAQRLMNEDLDGGIDWYLGQRLVSGEAEDARMSTVVHRLAGADIERAASWVLRQPDGPRRDHAEVAMAWQGVNRGDWTAGMEWLAEVSAADTRDAALREMFRRGWDQDAGALRPEVAAAAEGAGLGPQAASYQP